MKKADVKKADVRKAIGPRLGYERGGGRRVGGRDGKNGKERERGDGQAHRRKWDGDGYGECGMEMGME